MIHSYDEDRINFFHTDEHARKATKADAQTMDDLIDYLNEPFKDSPDRELHLARGILVWVQSNMDFKGNTGHTSPLRHVQTMAQRRLSPAAAFKLFFDAADIDCEVITGMAKAIRYRAGERDLATDSWLTFKAAEKMHWFHPGWSIQKIEGFKHSDERRLELDGQSLNDRSSSSTGTCVHSLNDFWFCLSPDIFKTRCHARMKDVISLQTFLTIPDLRQAFYVHRLSLLGCNENKIQAEHGKCTISLLADRENAKSVDLSYELIKHTGQLQLLDMDGEEDLSDLQQLVLHSVRKRTTHVFEVRLPFKGEYWLRIYAGNIDESEPKRKCSEFKIISNENNKEIKKYPTSCGLGVFGLSPKAEKAGLSNPSVLGAKLFVEATSHDPLVAKKTLVTFHLDEENASREYESELHADDWKKSSDQLNDCIETTKDSDCGTLTVKGRVPEKGEYSLVINALGDSVPGKRTKEAVACYLVTTEEKGSDEIIECETKQEEKIKRKEIKREKKQLLKENMTQEIDSLQKEIAAMKEEIGIGTVFTRLQRKFISTKAFADAHTKQFPRLTMETIGENVIFDGPLEDIEAANIYVRDIVATPCSITVSLTTAKAKLMQKNAIQEYIEKRINGKNLLAVVEIDGEQLIVEALDEQTTLEAVEIIESSVVEKHVIIGGIRKTFNYVKWEEMQVALSAQYGQSMDLTVVDTKRIVLCCTNNVFHEVHRQILSFLRTTEIVKEPYAFTESVNKIVLKYFLKSLTEIEEADEVDINGMEGCSTLLIEGRRENVCKAKHKLVDLENRYSSQAVTIALPGLEQFIKSEEGKRIVDQIEDENKVLISVLHEGEDNQETFEVLAIDENDLQKAINSLENKLADRIITLKVELSCEKQRLPVEVLIGTRHKWLRGFQVFVESVEERDSKSSSDANEDDDSDSDESYSFFSRRKPFDGSPTRDASSGHQLTSYERLHNSRPTTPPTHSMHEHTLGRMVETTKLDNVQPFVESTDHALLGDLDSQPSRFLNEQEDSDSDENQNDPVLHRRRPFSRFSPLFLDDNSPPGGCLRPQLLRQNPSFDSSPRTPPLGRLFPEMDMHYRDRIRRMADDASSQNYQTPTRRSYPEQDTCHLQ